MKLDEFAFVNQQLAGMLQSGIPLEGALRQLCATMQRGELRGELDQLGADLAQGTPLKDALAKRKLPEFYVRMIQIGVEGGNLPAVLLQLADYYTKTHSVWTRLQGLLVYPLLVLLVATGVAVIFATGFGTLIEDVFGDITVGFGSVPAADPAALRFLLWLPVYVLAGAAVALVVGQCSPALRRRLRWRLPGFQEASLAQAATAMSLLLRGGKTLPDSLALVQQLEAGTPAGAELARWQARLADGRGKFADLAADAKVFPPLFLWLVASAGEDLALGFARAAELYYTRAAHRIEMMLYAALPVSVFALGVMILLQTVPLQNVFRTFVMIMESIGGE